MKKRNLILVTALAFGFFTACDKGEETTPDAKGCFNYSPSENTKVGDEITFINCSEYATSYEWDFGDGDTSTEENPTHIYDEGGEFTVKLIARNEKSGFSINKTILIE